MPIGVVPLLRQRINNVGSSANSPATADDWLAVSLIFAMIGFVHASGRKHHEHYEMLPPNAVSEASGSESMLASQWALVRAKAYSEWHQLPVEIGTVQILLLHFFYKRFRQPLAASALNVKSQTYLTSSNRSRPLCSSRGCHAIGFSLSAPGQSTFR